MKFMLLIAAGIGSLAIQIFAGDLKTRHDASLGVDWITPSKIYSVKSHDGLGRMDTFTWKVYAAIAQHSDTKALALKLLIDGPELSIAYGAIRIDSRMMRLPVNGQRSFLMWNGNHGYEVTTPLTEADLALAAGAKGVWLTVWGNAGEKHSVKLSKEQIQSFREILDRYQKHP